MHYVSLPLEYDVLSLMLYDEVYMFSPLFRVE